MFLVYKSTFQGLAPTVGLLGLRCDAKVRPFGADSVHRRMGFKGMFMFWSYFCGQARGFYGRSSVLE